MQKVSEFFFDAMFNQETGYYRTKNPIGKTSDFITAPEISQTFGESIAAYILQIASTKKSPIALVEMGAGKGTLFFDILNSIKKLAEKNIESAVDFLERTTFFIIEINPVLRQIQQEKLADFSVSWYESFGEFEFLMRYPPTPAGPPPLTGGQAPVKGGGPQGRGVSLPELDTKVSVAELDIEVSSKAPELFFISNELFDCFPIDQFVFTESGWRERLVDGEKFTLADFDKETHDFVEKEIGSLAPIGAVFEYSSSARKFMAQLCEALRTQGGMAINIDYGYDKNLFANTLQALKNHRKVDVLKNPGSADITAQVDFRALNKITKEFNLNSSLISQKEFLLSLGIEQRRQNLLIKNPQKSSEINSAIDRLIDSDQMGDLFKCHIIWK